MAADKEERLIPMGNVLFLNDNCPPLIPLFTLKIFYLMEAPERSDDYLIIPYFARA